MFFVKLDDLRLLAAHFPYPITPELQDRFRTFLAKMGLDADNLYQELEMTSRFADTHQDTSFSNAVVQLHSHAFYEIIYCRNNCAAEYLVGTQRFRLQKGDIVLVPPGVSHRPLLPRAMEQPYVRDVLWVSRELTAVLRQTFPSSLLPRHDRGHLLRTAGTKWEYLGEMFHAGVREAENRAPGWEMTVTGNTISLIAHLKRAFQDTDTIPPKAEKPELPDQTIAYIEKNLANKITLEDAARELFVSSSTISQTFRNKMGVSFYRWVTQRRLIAAKTLIAEGLPLERVGAQVGFSDHSVFYRAFRKEYGISPRQYRKLLESSELPTQQHPDPGRSQSIVSL